MTAEQRPGTVEQLQTAARALSGMLADAVLEAERDAGKPVAARELKELTAILKDITGVVKALEPPAETGAETGVIILPAVEGGA